METKNLTKLDPTLLAALAKTTADAAKATREELPVGTHTVDTIVTLVVGAEVKVLEDQHGVLTPQKAKPWGLVHVLLEEVNKMRAAAGMAGLTIETLIEMAEKVDKDLVKKAQKDADKAVANLKEPTRSNRKGAVKVKGETVLPA